MFKIFTRKAGQKGFTLIELLVVIAIIGILASIVLASLNTARKKSRDARRIADLNQIRLAEELYFDSNSGQYSATLAALAAANSCGTGSTCIASVPIPPSGGGQTAYNYCTTPTTTYGVHAVLELSSSKPAAAITSVGCTGAWSPTVGASCGIAGDTNYCVGP